MFVISIDFFLLVDTKLRFYCTRFLLIKCVNYFHRWCDNNDSAFGSDSPTQQNKYSSTVEPQHTHTFIHCLLIYFVLFFSLYFRAKFFLLLLQLVSIVFSCCGYDRHFSFFSICFSCFDGTLLWRAHSCSLTIARTHTFVSSSAIVTMSYLIWIIQTWRRRKYWHCRIYAAHKVGKQMTNIK